MHDPAIPSKTSDLASKPRRPLSGAITRGSIAMAFTLWLTPALHGDALTQTLDVYWTDVEGGAGTLIVTPAGESILIDTGMPGGRDPGRIHRIATEEAGLEQIDFLITTHFHLDHFGGAAELSTMIPIRHVYDNGIPETNPDNRPNDRRFPLLIKPYKEMSVGERHLISPGNVLPLSQPQHGPELTVRCLGTRREFIDPEFSEENPRCEDAAERDRDMSDNANSVVTLIQWGDFRFFVGGDLTWNVEKNLVCPVNRVGQVDVYQVNHHGLETSNHPVLVHSLAPTVSVMSNGTSKGCGANSFHTLKTSPGIQAMYQIHRNLREDSENNTRPDYIANLEKDCDGHFIRMTVAPNAATYTISIPAKNHHRLFATKTQ